MEAADLESPLAHLTADAQAVEGEECPSTLRVLYSKRRPMHPGRFFSFVRKRFGPLDMDLKPSSSERTGSQGSSGLGALCRRRRRPDEREVAQTEELVPLEAPASLSRGVVVRAAGGCLWFVGSDDRKAEWHFNSGGESSVSGSSRAEQRRHRLRCGNPWPVGELDMGNEAGERRNELEIFCEHRESPQLDDFLGDEGDPPPPAPSSEVKAANLRLAESLLRKELDLCLLTRREAEHLEEAGDSAALDGLEEWEGHRTNFNVLAPWVTRWAPLLGTLHTFMGFVSAIPGTAQLATVGHKLASKMTKSLGGMPEGPGHDDNAGEED